VMGGRGSQLEVAKATPKSAQTNPSPAAAALGPATPHDKTGGPAFDTRAWLRNNIGI
jgi:hypothetical protein